jgi:hypothetical protein
VHIGRYSCHIVEHDSLSIVSVWQVGDSCGIYDCITKGCL